MSWRLAKSLEQLRREVNAAYPRRSKTSDGTIGDARHRAAGTSDHNPNELGVVRAWDCTDDDGLADEVAEHLRRSRDPRVKYVIHDHRMFSSYARRGYPAWTWRPYSGSNPHVTHMHVSVHGDKARYDDARPWGFAADNEELDVLKKGDEGPEVAHVQHRLNVAGYDAGAVDGDFGPATEAAVNRLKASGGLAQDGLVTAVTLDLLRERLAQQGDGGSVDAHDHDERYAPREHAHTGAVTVR